jgi:hypothetical protein
MAILRFSIVGAADSARNNLERLDAYKPQVRIDETKAIAKALGTEIAKRGHGLLVYDANFIEADAVEGYVAANPTPSSTLRPIIIRQPQDGKLVPFKEEATHPTLFERRADKSGLWEVSFYRSLADSDGLILLGGAYSTSIAGQVAIGARIPVLALERTGGSASTVWKTIAPGIDLPSIDEHARMAHELTSDTVSGWVDALEAQRRRRYAVESGPILWHAVYASVLFGLSLAAALGSHLIPGLPEAAGKALLFSSTLLAGAAGAAIRMVFERRYGSGPLVPPSIAITFALGMMAGALAGLLYLVAQPSSLALAGESGLRLVSIVAVVSTIGGLTAETIFRKLLGIDVLQTRSIAAGGDRPGAGGSQP